MPGLYPILSMTDVQRCERQAAHTLHCSPTDVEGGVGPLLSPTEVHHQLLGFPPPPCILTLRRWSKCDDGDGAVCCQAVEV